MADAARKYSDKQLKALEGRLKREYAQAAKEITEKAAKYFAQFAEKDAKKQEELKAGKITQEQYKSWRWGQMMTGKRWTAMKETLANDLTNVRKTAIQMANDTLPEIYAESANYATYTIEKGARVDTSFTLYSKDTVRALAEAKEIPLPKRKVDVAKDKKWNTQKVTSAVLQGVLQGESVDKIAKKLQTVTDMNRRAAARNARTMVTAAENQGRADMYTRAEDMGIQLEQVWIATLDGRTRDSHRHLDGERIKTGGKFSNGLRYPGDPNGSAAEIYNCRCTMRAVVEGIDDDLSDLSQRNTNKLQGLSYEEWKGAKEGTNTAAATSTAPEYKTFDTGKSANEYFYNSEAYKSWKDGLTHDESTSITQYTGSVYKKVNGYLRDKSYKFSSEEAKDKALVHIKNLDSAINGFELQENITVYRACNRATAFSGVENMEELLTTGYNDKAFMSTTSSEIVFNDYFKNRDCRLAIHVPAGQGRGAYVNQLSGWQDIEYEFLIKRDTQFSVSSVVEKDGKWYIDMEVIADD